MINWDNIHTVLLDMDGTLLDLHYDNYFWLQYVPKVYSETFDVAHDEALRHLHQRFEQERGTMAWYCLDFWSDELKLDIVGLKRDIEAKIAIRPKTEEFLQALQATDKKVLLVTNAHRGSLDLKMEKTGLDKYFEALISTHDYGVPKEDTTLWEVLKADYHYDPASTLLVDDTEAVLASAELYGIRYLLGMKQPDSTVPERENLKYPSILYFDEVMP